MCTLYEGVSRNRRNETLPVVPRAFNARWEELFREHCQHVICSIHDVIIIVVSSPSEFWLQFWEQMVIGWGKVWRIGRVWQYFIATATREVWAGALSCRSKTPLLNFPRRFSSTHPLTCEVLVRSRGQLSFLPLVIVNHDDSVLVPECGSHDLLGWRHRLDVFMSRMVRHNYETKIISS